MFIKSVSFYEMIPIYLALVVIKVFSSFIYNAVNSAAAIITDVVTDTISHSRYISILADLSRCT